MVKKTKDNNGITLVALALTVIAMLIIGGVSIYEGRRAIGEAKIQTLETNMLAIKAKAKAYAEEVDAGTWALNDTEKANKKKSLYTGSTSDNGYGMAEFSINSLDNTVKSQIYSEINQSKCEVYEITNNTLEKMGLKDIAKDEGSKYLVIYDSDNFNKMDIVYTNGIQLENETYYTLSVLQSISEE